GAAAGAARRRGSSKRMRPGAAKPASRMAGGTCVVLPAPVGARKTTHACRCSAASRSGRIGSIGNGTGVMSLSKLSVGHLENLLYVAQVAGSQAEAEPLHALGGGAV